MIAFDKLAFPSTSATVPEKPRTPAQIEASRLNGCKSTGPVAPEGKRRVARNALQHGLLARRIAPWNGGGADEVDFKHCLIELRREFQPKTFSDNMAVEALAHDYIQLARIKQMQNVATGSTTVPGRLIGLLPTEFEGWIGCLEEQLLRCKKGKRFNAPRMLAKPVVGRLVDILQEVETAARKCKRCKPGSRKSLQYLEETTVHEAVAGSGIGCDSEQLLAVLAGEMEITPSQRQGWDSLIQYVLRRWRMRREGLAEEFADFQRKNTSLDLNILHRVPSLEILARYETTVRRSIQRTLEGLHC